MADQYTEEHAGQLQDDATPTAAQAGDKAIVTEAVDALAFCKSYEQVQRQSESDELEFEGVDMWTEKARNDRSEHTDDSTGRKIPAKPTISVNLLDQNIQQVVSEARQARLALTVKPKAGLANTKTGEYIKGLVRGIQIESGSLEIRLWALERTAKVGRGGWRIEAVFAEDEDFDLDLREARILDYGTVYWDPYRQRADNEDANWCLLTDWISEDDRRRRWPTKPIIPTDHAFESETDDWFAVDAENPKHRRVRIAVFFKVEFENQLLGFHPQFGKGWIGLSAVPADSAVPVMPEAYAKAVVARAPGTRRRQVEQRHVVAYTVDGSQLLSRDPWHGKYIPVIETIGKEYFVKGKRRFKGMIANTVDILRAINVLVSSATEIAGSMPRSPYLMAAGQDSGFEDMWDDAPVKNFTRLYYNTKDVDGETVGAPQRQQTELQINGLIVLLRMMHEMFHAISGSVAPQMRAVNPLDRSGKAIEALQRQGAAGTSNYLDNLATISMLYEGRVLLDAIPHYYDRPGRVLRVVGEESDDETAIMLKRPFIRDKDGAPVPVPCPACHGSGQVRSSTWNPFAPMGVCPACAGSTFATKQNMPEVYQDKEVEYVDFSDGAYKILAAVDRDYQTKQDEALAGMAQLAQSAPELVPTYADLWVRAMGFSGSTEIADRIKSRMPGNDDDLKDIPPQLLGRFLQLQEQHKQAMQALEQAHQMLQTDAVKTAGQKEIAMIKAAVAGKLETIKAQGRMLEVRADGVGAEHLEVLRGQIKQMQQESEQRHEILMQLLKELGAKEQERHSVGLHAAAATKAAEEADLFDTRADARKALMDTAGDQRAEGAAAREHQRGEESATAADQRAEEAAKHAAAREAERDVTE